MGVQFAISKMPEDSDEDVIGVHEFIVAYDTASKCLERWVRDFKGKRYRCGVYEGKPGNWQWVCDLDTSVLLKTFNLLQQSTTTDRNYGPGDEVDLLNLVQGGQRLGRQFD